ncbi:tigger transposable element-derived protein 4-like isoform X1 [Xenopus laevis]|uniref:Tigger transposable element-derived protein 4-like isoform X1 n=1 Tax=Xenopus laevis TaxID=8355 RepID=A0A8J0TZP2_XENLA|nr:tigger transposable element-derived protein 4-like isoform X1 [Xenopus laevis]
MSKAQTEGNPGASQHPFKKRRDSTLAEKVKILELLQQPKASQSSVARNLGLSQSTISRVMKNREEILERWSQNENPCRKRNRPFKHAKVDEALLEWLLFAKANKLPISGPILMRRAEAIAKEIGCPQFKPSNGWLWRWKERYRLFYRTEVLPCQRSGMMQGQDVQESKIDYDKMTAKGYCLNADERSEGLTRSEVHDRSSQLCPRNRSLTLAQVAREYHSQDIFCGIESLFQFRAMAGQGFMSEHKKESVCIWFCCNMNGTEKLKLLVTHNLPAKFVGAHSLSPVFLKLSHNGYLTEGLFIEWLLTWDSKLARQDRKVLLFLMVHGTVPKVKLRNISLCLFPKNNTNMSSTNLFGQELVSEFNALYKQLLLERFQEDTNVSRGSGVSFLKQLSHMTLVEASYTMNKAWLRISSCTIKNCFQKILSTQAFCSARPQPTSLVPNKDIPILMLQGAAENLHNYGPFTAGLGTYRKVTIKEECVVEQEDDDEFEAPSSYLSYPIQKVKVGDNKDMAHQGGVAKSERDGFDLCVTTKDNDMTSTVGIKSEVLEDFSSVQELKGACGVIQRFLSSQGQDMSIFCALQGQIERCLDNQCRKKHV